MNREEAAQLIESLRSGTSKRVQITKEAFLVFRQELVQQPDFKHFRGTARHGGAVDYEYTNTPRS